MKIRSCISAIFLMTFFIYVYPQTSQKYQLSTHVLDLSEGKPASGIVVTLYKYDTEQQDWDFVDKAVTAENGRIDQFLESVNNNYGAYKLRFETEPHFKDRGLKSIYPYIEVAFYISEGTHYHIPITVSANGYSTYRGN